MEKLKLSKEEIIKTILDDPTIEMDDDEAIDLILEYKVSKNIDNAHKNTLTRGDVMADKLATFAGSWVFISIFLSVLVIWIIINILLMKNAYDPYPFILLNLVLSCIAAIQAPVIMMSQNRQEEKDRIRAKNDYRVNLKSELLTEDVHNKIDRLISNQEEIIKRLKTLEK